MLKYNVRSITYIGVPINILQGNCCLDWDSNSGSLKFHTSVLTIILSRLSAIACYNFPPKI